MGVKYCSQYKQDFFVDKLFKKKKKGFFLDIGAHDGMSYSNSFFFEKKRNWKGICIEPNPTVFERLQQNRKSINYNVCITDVEGIVKYRKIEGYAEMLSGIVEFMDDAHLQRINDECKSYGGSYVDIDVKCMNINSILEENNISKIDFLSIDTEGAEYKIIKSIDFDKYIIECLVVENNNLSNEIRDLLSNRGYKFIHYKSDDFFLKDTRLLTRLKYYIKYEFIKDILFFR